MIAQRRFALGLGLILALVGSAAQAAKRNHVRLVIAPVSGKKTAAMNVQIASLVGKPIEKSLTLVSYTAVTRAATKTGLPAQTLTDNDTLAKAARAAGASHVLLIATSDASSKKGAAPLGMRASLLETATGDVIWSHRYSLIDQKLTPPVANQLIADVRKILGVSKSGRAIRAPYASTTVPPPPLAEPPTPPADGAGAQNLPPDIGRNNASQADMIAEAQKNAEPLPAAQAATAPATSPEEVAKRRRLRFRPGLRLSLGEAIFTRAAFVNAGPNDHPPCYCLSPGKSIAVFGRTALHIELYPLSFDPYGDWWEGFGASLDATVGVLKTGLPSGSVVSSTVGGYDFALMYRWVWPEPLSSYDATFKLGYSKWSFPLSGAQFPGVGFNVLYAGLATSLGVVDWLDVLVDGGYRYRVVGFGGTSVLGAAQISSGHGYYFDAGARFKVWEGLELTALFFLDHYYVPFFGGTAIKNQTGTNLQYNNVTLTDTYVGATLSVGYRF